jgi:uncharacterized hydrophobic protein (TIGR00271 family)
MKEDKWYYGFLKFLRLTHEEEDHAVIHETIEKGVVFRGTNLWILIFAIVIASVGLNMNSTAVVIGAMLISPIMGPINGVGYSVATYDFALLRKSLINLAFATSAGLIASTIYFTLTPIHTEHSELLARTSPTIYDVLIAAFGGLAGIVAISSKNKGNVIPGVAIATALMPPLCTAGYGVSIGNWGYFLGAMYLFLINSVFIALASMIVSQFMELPKKSSLLSREIKNKNILVIIIVLITVVPSFYLGITLVRKERFKTHADSFVEKVAVWEGNYLLDNKVDPDTKTITLIYGGNEFSEVSEERLKDKAKDLNLADAKIVVKQGLKVNDMTLIQESNDQISEHKSEIRRLQTALLMKQHELDSLSIIPETGESLLREIRTLYPQIETCSYASTFKYIDSTKTSIPSSIVYFTASDTMAVEDQVKIKRWLRSRLNVKDVTLKF